MFEEMEDAISARASTSVIRTVSDRVKTLAWSNGEQVNIVTSDTAILPQIQDATKNDTIITFSIEETPASRSFADTANHWGFAKVKEGAFDVIYKHSDESADEMLQISAYTDSTFTLDNAIYHNLKK